MTAREEQAAPSNWNVPNALTTLRIVMVPFLGWTLLVDHGTDNAWRWVAWAIFALAMVTDKVDGDLVRAVVEGSEGVDLVARVLP